MARGPERGQGVVARHHHRLGPGWPGGGRTTGLLVAHEAAALGLRRAGGRRAQGDGPRASNPGARLSCSRLLSLLRGLPSTPVASHAPALGYQEDRSGEGVGAGWGRNSSGARREASGAVFAVKDRPRQALGSPSSNRLSTQGSTQPASAQVTRARARPPANGQKGTQKPAQPLPPGEKGDLLLFTCCAHTRLVAGVGAEPAAQAPRPPPDHTCPPHAQTRMWVGAHPFCLLSAGSCFVSCLGL